MWVKANQKDVVEKFAGTIPAVVGRRPISIFMAGSPGAGKTEFSKHLIELLHDPIVRIDADEVRSMLPQYKPGTAHLFQAAVSIAVEKIHDHTLKKGKDFLLDATFLHLEKARDNIRRSLEKERDVLVEYIFQEPLVAWDFTQKREAVEGRNILKEKFVEQLFAARDTVDSVKSEFGDRIRVVLVRRNIQTNIYEKEDDVQRVADKVVVGYTKEELLKHL